MTLAVQTLRFPFSLPGLTFDSNRSTCNAEHPAGNGMICTRTDEHRGAHSADAYVTGAGSSVQETKFIWTDSFPQKDYTDSTDLFVNGVSTGMIVYYEGESYFNNVCTAGCHSVVKHEEEMICTRHVKDPNTGELIHVATGSSGRIYGLQSGLI